MNLIESQAKEFYRFKFKQHGDYKKFIQELRWELNEYHGSTQKFEFINSIRSLLKAGYEKHLPDCQHPNDRYKCAINMLYENSLFFVQNEIEKLKEEFGTGAISISERESISERLDQVLHDLNTLKMGQQLTYDDLLSELEELKDFYYLDKKTWSQLFLGKLTEMVASGLVSETISKKLIEILESTYSN